MKKLFLLAVVLLFCNVAAAQEFDFKGAVLGMSPSDFDALPDLMPQAMKGKFSKNTCKMIEDKMECQRTGDNPFGAGNLGATYYFSKDLHGEIGLFWILLIAKRAEYSSTLLGLTTKWGEGRTVEFTTTNGLGQEIKGAKTKWSKPGSEIVLESPCVSVINMCLTYTHKTRYAEYYSNKKTEESRF